MIFNDSMDADSSTSLDQEAIAQLTAEVTASASPPTPPPPPPHPLLPVLVETGADDSQLPASLLASTAPDEDCSPSTTSSTSSSTDAVTVSFCQQRYPQQSCQLAPHSAALPDLPPFRLLHGEHLLRAGTVAEGQLFATNYRLYLHPLQLPVAAPARAEATAAPPTAAPPATAAAAGTETAAGGHFNLPRGLLDLAEMKDMFSLLIYCKDGRTFRMTAAENESATFWLRYLNKPLYPSLADSFCFGFRAWCVEQGQDDVHPILSAGYTAATTLDAFKTELERLEFDMRGAWRISTANDDFQLCASYPRYLLVPLSISDDMVAKVARFRALHRIPAVCWRHRRTGAVLARSGQPEVGWLGWRSPEDEELVKAISEASAANRPPLPPPPQESPPSRQHSPSPAVESPPTVHPLANGLAEASVALSPSPRGDACMLAPPHGFTNTAELTALQTDGVAENAALSDAADVQADTAGPANGDVPSLRDLSEEALLFKNTEKVVIVDARSYTAAVANRARGGGVECNEYYPNCEIVFMNLPNIHTIRKSFQALRTLLASPTDHTSWHQALEGTRWLTYVLSLLRAAAAVVRYMDELSRSVLVHCSDGWDRTPQITALAQLLMDPHYRTFQGFGTLLEREWLDFGHKFADRCGLPGGTEDNNERCPVFLQWLDCVYQLTVQFPCAFEFNAMYLAKLALHTYSSLFGTFVCNSAKDRAAAGLHLHTYSVFAYLRANREVFTNYLYNAQTRVLVPSLHPRHLCLWSAVYLGSVPASTVDDVMMSREGGGTAGGDPPPPPTLSETSSCAEPPAAPSLCRTRSHEELSERRELCRTASDPSLLDSCSKELCNGDSVPAPLPLPTAAVPLAVAAAEPIAVDVGEAAAGADAGVVEEEIEDGRRSADAPEDPSSLVAIDVVAVAGSTDTLSEDPRREQSTSTSDLHARLRAAGVGGGGVPSAAAAAAGGRRRPCTCRQPRRSPQHSRTPSSGYPATPTDDRLSEKASCPPSRRLQLDGMSRVWDDVQERLYHMHLTHKNEVDMLRRDLQLTRQALCDHLCRQCMRSHLPDDTDSGVRCGGGAGAGAGCSGPEELGSLGRQSSVSDVSSWEAVDETEARPQLWMPDHAVARCSGCDVPFWLGRRRHHCRACGNVYCADCTRHVASVPHEQLFNPVRVCGSCYVKLVSCQLSEPSPAVQLAAEDGTATAGRSCQSCSDEAMPNEQPLDVSTPQ